MTLSSFLTKFRPCSGKLITIKQNEEQFLKTSVKGLKIRMACCIWFSLVTRLTVTWVGTSASRICTSGLRLSSMNIPIAHLAKRKWLCGLSLDKMASSGHTSLKARMRIRWRWTQTVTLYSCGQSLFLHWGGKGE